ncbi:MAG TPA: type II toxin-antitoxin system VapC family toxin [Egibacteraceae bacterium]|nr:type II toxin-antitoxin system VapC family toxin [Egibacteraceae bacterium]
MSVRYASVYAEALTAATPIGAAARHALKVSQRWHAPAILPAEVLSALRGMVLGGHLAAHRANRARERLGQSRIRLHSFAPHAERVWELRENLTVYDAWYVAVAEALGATLLTTDGRLAGASGIRCDVRHVTGQ